LVAPAIATLQFCLFATCHRTVATPHLAATFIATTACLLPAVTATYGTHLSCLSPGCRHPYFTSTPRNAFTARGTFLHLRRGCTGHALVHRHIPQPAAPWFHSARYLDYSSVPLQVYCEIYLVCTLPLHATFTVMLPPDFLFGLVAGAFFLLLPPYGSFYHIPFSLPRCLRGSDYHYRAHAATLLHLQRTRGSFTAGLPLPRFAQHFPSLLRRHTYCVPTFCTLGLTPFAQLRSRFAGCALQLIYGCGFLAVAVRFGCALHVCHCRIHTCACHSLQTVTTHWPFG